MDMNSCFFIAKCIELRSDYFNASLGQINTGIKLKTDQYDKRIKEHPDHYYNKSSY